jgi:hypothetical protein
MSLIHLFLPGWLRRHLLLAMDVTDSDLTTALQEAFTCYLAYLSHTQKARESALPRQGKGVETAADLSTQQYFQTRVAATELCLQYTEKIARRVWRWTADPHEDVTMEGLSGEAIPTVEHSALDFKLALPDNLEDPFLDVFSGNWIKPITPFSAGPSGSTNEATEYKPRGPGKLKVGSFRTTLH